MYRSKLDSSQNHIVISTERVSDAVLFYVQFSGDDVIFHALNNFCANFYTSKSLGVYGFDYSFSRVSGHKNFQWIARKLCSFEKKWEKAIDKSPNKSQISIGERVFLLGKTFGTNSIKIENKIYRNKKAIEMLNQLVENS